MTRFAIFVIVLAFFAHAALDTGENAARVHNGRLISTLTEF